METTHAAWGSGRPRLAVARTLERREFSLDDDIILIGSAADNHVVLPGTDALHARIDHRDDDEYVLTLFGEGTMNAVSLVDGQRIEVLRTGAIFTIGEWTLVFMRDEYADHGRPYGGRQGGEYSVQQSQPPRPDYSDEHAGERARREAARSLISGEPAEPTTDDEKRAIA